MTTNWDGLSDAERAAWGARADTAHKALAPFFAPSVVGLRYAGSHAAHLSMWHEGITRDLGLVNLPDFESEAAHD